MIPAWSAFQELSCNSDLDQVNVGYLPPIPNTPTDMKTIYAAIRRTQDIMEELETNLIFIEVDQAIYTKVLDAMFRLKDEGENLFDNIIPRLGGFHILICMLRTIYSLFHNCGFVQLLSAAGLGGIGTVQKNLNGGDVKEGILLHKKLFEALLRSKIEYIDANGTPGTEETSEGHQLPALLDALRKILNSTAVENVLNSNTLKELPRLPGDMSTFMDIYLDMVNMMLNFIHFLRTGNWIGYLQIIFQFLPYCFRLNRHNYSRNLSYYYVHMMSLREENSSAFKYLEDGGFSGSLSCKPHSRIPFDEIIEMTINRSSKDIGGLSGNTQNLGATERWARI